MLQSPQPPPIEAILTELLNEVAMIPEGFVLVLDDYHTILTQTIHDGLVFLLDNLPEPMHLMIAGRTDPPLPLPQYRVRRELVDVHAEDLRFTLEEAAAFLNQIMGLNLPAGDIETVDRMTEGWVAGLQLAALSVQGAPDRSNLIRSFSGSHRYVFDYLAQEVLNRQPEAIRSFLVRTSVLERLSAPSGGTHQLAVEIRHGEELIEAPAQSFAFDLQPPDPAFLSPTLEILRKFPGSRQKNLLQKADPDQLSPKAHDLQVLVDFPDGHARPLVRTTLYVDGKVVDENTGPPFDQFTWDLSGYTESGQHLLRVEAVDSLGLTGTSIETPFDVQVDPIFQSPLALLSRQAPVVGGAAILIAGAILFLALILGGRLHPHAIGVQGRLRRLRRKSRLVPRAALEKTDGPLLETGENRGAGWVNRLHWPQRRLAPKAFAFLTRLSGTPLPQDYVPTVIALTAQAGQCGHTPF